MDLVLKLLIIEIHVRPRAVVLGEEVLTGAIALVSLS